MKMDFDEFKSFVLMNKNKPVLQFYYDEETHSVMKIGQVYNAAFSPVGVVDFQYGLSRKALNEWWKKRAIPASRDNFTRIMQQLRIESPVELLEKCSGFSLSDQYWVRESDSNVSWKELNFFENDFSGDIGRLLLGQADVFLDLDTVSPDNASDGNLMKKWKIINGERYLIKGGNSFNNQEPYNEVIATALYERILNPGEFVPYFLIEDEGKKYSACKTMVTTNEELVSALAIDGVIKLKENELLYTHFLVACSTLGIQDAEIMTQKMITCDYILANFDRHYRNFGAIRNVETLEWKGFAPLYDSGSSLWATTPTREIAPFNFKTNCFKADPREQFKLVTDLSWLDDKKLVGFEADVTRILSRNPLMDGERISLIAKQVELRVQDVLSRKRDLEKFHTPRLDDTIQRCELLKKEANHKQQQNTLSWDIEEQTNQNR